MARKQRGATLDGKAKVLLTRLEEAAECDDAALVLHTYGRVCNLVGKSVVDSTLSTEVRGSIKAAHDKKYRPVPDPVPAT